MNRDPRVLYGADFRKRILDEVEADIARLATRRKVGRLVSVGNSRIVGDANTGAVADVASWTTPVPGGVDPVTVAMLMRNAAIAFEKQIELRWV